MASAPQSTSEDPRRSGGKKRNEIDPARMGEPIRGPTHDQIARRAYEIYLARGCEDGHAEEDWRQAERDLMLGRY